MKRLVPLLAAAALGCAVLAGSAGADGTPVGTPGTPNCHGVRVSAGSSQNGLTPVDRANALTDIIQGGQAGEFGQLLEQLFGTDVSVQEFQEWVRLNCEAPTG
jgi:hypothetical protein